MIVAVMDAPLANTRDGFRPGTLPEDYARATDVANLFRRIKSPSTVPMGALLQTPKTGVPTHNEPAAHP